MSLLSIFKKISFVLAIHLIISPIFFIQAKIVSAKEQEFVVDANGNLVANPRSSYSSNNQTANVFVSFINALSSKVYCGISGIFINSCELKGTQVVNQNTSTTNQNNTTQVVFNRNENRTEVTEVKPISSNGTSGVTENFVLDRLNELATILRTEINNSSNVTYVVGQPGPQGPQGERGPSGGGGRGPRGNDGEKGEDGEDAFVVAGPAGYILQSDGTTTQWVATTTLGFGAGTPGTGTVTSVDMTVPTGLSVTGGPITTSGTFAVSLTSGYVIPLTASTTNWNTAYSWGDHSTEGYLTSLDVDNLSPIEVGSGNTTITSLGVSSVAIGRNNDAGFGTWGGGSSIGTNNTSGTGAAAFGNYNSATGGRSVAFGFSNTASSTHSIAFGLYNNAPGQTSMAFGYGSLASASGAIAFGNGITNDVASSTMIGPSNSAKVTILNTGEFKAQFINATSTTATSTFNGAVDLKSRLLANGNAGTAGYILQNTGTGVEWVATSTLGFGAGDIFSTSTTRSVFSSSATGLTYNSSTGDFSLTSGYNIPLTASTTNWNTAYSWGDHSTEGYLTLLDLNALDPIEVGNGNTNSGANSAAFGINNTLDDLEDTSNNSTVVGISNYVLGNFSSAIGYNNETSSNYANAFGSNNFAAGTASAFGHSNSANSPEAVAVGFSNLSSHNSSVAIGSANTAQAIGAIAVGRSNNVSALGASAFGTGIINGTASSTMIGPSNAAKVTILNTGEVQLNYLTTASTTATSTFNGGVNLLGRLLANGSAGTSGYVLQTTGTGVQWVATSSLGISGGGSETDPVFLASQAFNIDATDITNLSNLSGINTGDQDLSGLLVRSNNLSDLTSSSTARTNLGLGTLATLNTINNSNWSGTPLSISNGGTGTTTAPTFGQILLGNNSGGYDLVSTSSLGISGGGSTDVNALADIEVGFGNTVLAGYSNSAFGYQNNATGSRSFAAGYQSTASEYAALAIGKGAIASGNASISIGNDYFGSAPNTASGIYSMAIGSGNVASGQNTTVIGLNNTGTTNDSVIVGTGNNVSSSSEFDASSTVFGIQNTSSGYYGSVLFGKSNTVSSNYAAALGTNNNVIGQNTIAVGNNNFAQGNFSSVFGYGSAASSTLSSAFGYKSIASGIRSTAAGYANNAFGYRSVALGYRNTTALSATNTSAIGYFNNATGGYSLALGSLNTSSGYESTVVGKSNTASSTYSMAFGRGNAATGDRSFVFGYGSTASGSFASAFGYGLSNTIANSLMIGPSQSAAATILSTGEFRAPFFTSTSTATSTFNGGVNLLGRLLANGSAGTSGYVLQTTGTGVQWVATSSLGISGGGGGGDVNALNPIQVGFGNSATGIEASAFGFNTTASGYYSSAFGYRAVASGLKSSASGYYSTSAGNYSTAAGYATYADGERSAALGSSNSANEDYSVAVGVDNRANGIGSVAIGRANSTNNGIDGPFFATDDSVVMGAYNYADKEDIVAVGFGNNVYAIGASAFGRNLTNNIANSVMIGSSQSGAVTILSTGELRAPSITATSTTATSTFNGAVDLKSRLLANGNAGTAGYILQNTGTGVEWVATSSIGFVGGGGGSSQWSDAGSNIYFSTGNVGIGTSTPGYALVVAGDTNLTGALRVNGNAGTNGQVLLSTGSGLQWVATSSLGISGGGGGGDVNALNPIQVGFGNTSSGLYASAMGYTNTASADYSSAFGFNNQATATNASAFGSDITNNIANSTMIGPSNTAKITILSSGNLGVGTTTPGHRLTVAGDFSLTGALRINNDAGTAGYILQSTGSGLQWVATSSVGFVGGGGGGGDVNALNPIQVGASNTAAGAQSSAIGYQNSSSGDYSSAFGYQNISQYNSSAFGYSNDAQGEDSAAFGYDNTVSTYSRYSIAFGVRNTVQPNSWNSSAVGYLNSASAAYSASAFGSENFANSDFSSAFGYSNIASTTNSTALGYSNFANANNASAVGYDNTATGLNSSAFGNSNNVSGERASAFGYQNTVSGYQGAVVGSGNTVSGYGSTAVGENNTVDDGGVAVGSSNTAVDNISGGKTIAVGHLNQATGGYAVAIGWNNAADYYAVAIGNNTTAFGSRATAVGIETNATTDAGAFGIGIDNSDADTVVFGYGGGSFGAADSGVKVYGNSDGTNPFLGSSIQFLGYGAGSLTTNGSGVITASSDERLKDIEKMYDGSLDALRQINPIVYKWNDVSGLADGLTYVGFSAQNIQSVIPEAVNEAGNGNLSLQDRPIMALTINAVKELDEKINWMSDYVSQSAEGVIAFFKELTVDRLNINGEVCVDDVCVTKEQFKSLLEENGGESSNVTSDSSLISETPSVGTTTPESQDGDTTDDSSSGGGTGTTIDDDASTTQIDDTSNDGAVNENTESDPVESQTEAPVQEPEPEPAPEPPSEPTPAQ